MREICDESFVKYGREWFEREGGGRWLCWWFVVVMLVRMKRKESFVIHIELALIVLYCLNCKDEENNEFFS
jgi:hypothetical protein